MNNPLYPTSEVSQLAPEKWWLEDDLASILAYGNFSGANC